jgi:hypothetical protein
MDHHELGVAMAVGHLAELRRHAAAANGPRRATTETAMLLHHHEQGVFDPDHCRTCARQAGLLDHYHRVPHQEARLWQAHRLAQWALWSSAAAILLAAIALLSG